MKKIIVLLAAVALLGGCAPQSDIEQSQEINKEETVVVETPEEESQASQASYTLKTDTYVDETDNIYIDYLVMTDYPGELTQDYINQSFVSIIDLYSNNDLYEKVQIMPEIWLTTDDRISILYNGTITLSGGRTVEVLHPINIDVASSNEITFDNLFNDTEVVRKLVGDKVISEGISDFFEAEGIRIYMNDEKVFFAYMPLDDSASEFIKVSLERSELEGYMNTDFGQHPAS